MTAVQRSGHGLSESSGEVGRLGLRAAIMIPLGALVAWALVGAGFLNYDTAYSLLWGGDVAHLRRPDFDVPVAPTPHPLATLLGVILTPFGDFGQTLWVVIAFLSLGALAWTMLVQDSQAPHGSSRGPCGPVPPPASPAQFSEAARILAMEVLPVPREPTNRYAWCTRSCSIALRSVRTTCSWPTTSAKLRGRWRR